MKTYRLLKSQNVTADDIARHFAGKGTVDLLNAIHNPDHSAAAVSALRAILHGQGVTDEQIEASRWNENELSVLPISKKPSVDQALRRPKSWRVIYRVVQILSLALLISGVYIGERDEMARQAKVDELITRGVIPKDEYEAWKKSGIFKYRPDVSQYQKPGYIVIVDEINQRTISVDDLNQKVLGRYAPGDIPNSPWAGILVLAALIIFGPIKIAIWRWPARILLLRPFNTKDVSRSLKRFIRHNVIFSGHVFTLADRHLKESLFLYIISFVPTSPEGVLMLLLYPWVKRTRRRIYVKKASDFRALEKRLGSRRLLNTFWTNSWWDKIRKVRTVDSWWQRSIDLLAVNCDVILVDLTLVKAGTRWELTQLRDQKLEEKAIFIVQKEKLEHGNAVLAEYWPGASLPALYSYDEKGRLESSGDFNNHFAKAVSRPRPPFTGEPRLYWGAIFSLVLWLYPVFGLPISLYSWGRIAHSEGRLKGKALAQVGTALSLLTSAALIYLLIQWVGPRP